MGFLGGAALLTAAVAVSKLLGALYKIPLGNLLGSRGMGCFQVAYNVYGVLLTLSTAGLPLAMSRLIAQSRGRPRRQRRIFHVALALFLALGLVGSGVMLTFPRQLSGLLHNELAAPSIRVLAPALLAVCLLSAIRGYTQGQGQMLPTAVSQVVESAGKLVVGLGLTWYLLTVRGVSPEIGAAGAMAGVTAGSLLALLVLALRWLPSCMGSDAPPSRREVLGQLLKIGVPITLGAGGMSFITLLDQSVAMDALQSRLGLGLEEANRQYGEYAFALTLFSLPPSFLYPISVSLVPAISGALGQGDRRTGPPPHPHRPADGAAAGAAVGDRAVRSGRACPAAAVPRSGADRRCRRPSPAGAGAGCRVRVPDGGLRRYFAGMGPRAHPGGNAAHRRGGEDRCQLPAGVGPRLGHPGRRRGNTALLCAYCGDEPTGGGTHHWDSLSLGRSSPDAGGSGGHGGDGLRLLSDAGTPGFPAAGRAGSRSGSRCGVRRSRPAAGGSAPRGAVCRFCRQKAAKTIWIFLRISHK